MNLVAHTGRFVKDPELRTNPEGKSVVNFSLAVDDPDNNEITDFFNYVAWGSTAEFIGRYFVKGQKIEIVGKLKTRIYEKDGAKRKIVEIKVNSANFAEKKREDSTSNTPTEIPNNSVSTTSNASVSAGVNKVDNFTVVPNDDLPF